MGESDRDAPYQPTSARRFGGPNSPGGMPGSPMKSPMQKLRSALTVTDATRRRMRYRKRLWAIMLFASPLLFAAFRELGQGDPLAMLRNFGLFVLFGFAAFTIREGVQAEAEYEERNFASPPSLPRKALGAVMIGAALALTCGFGWGIGPIQSVLFGIIGAGAAVLTFGFDPMRAKGETTATGITPRMVSEAILEAEQKIAGIEEAAATLQDSPLRERVARVTVSARQVLKRIEEDPSDLRRARKFLKVYLDGALEATRKYAKNQHDLTDSTMYVKFRSLLDDMEQTFDTQEQKLLRNDHIDLEVEIEVLAERVKRESAL